MPPLENPSNPNDAREAVSVLVVDHTTLPGGAELALPRYAAKTQISVNFVFLEPAREHLQFPKSATVIAPPRPLGFIRQLCFLRSAIERYPMALIVSNTLRASIMVALVKPRHQQHAMLLHDGVDKESLSTWKRWALRLIVLRHNVRIIPNSEWSASTVPARFTRCLTPATYSFSGTSVVAERPRRDPSGVETIRILSLSRLVSWKGIHVILEALEHLEGSGMDRNAIQLTVAGAAVLGPNHYVAALKEQASRLKFDIRFVGHVENVEPLLLCNDVLVHSSTRPEPFGQVVVQGMHYGLIVIATNQGGPPEIVVDGESGLLYAPGDSRALADIIRKLANDRGLAVRVAAGGVLRADQFTDATIAGRLDAVLADIRHERAAT